MKHAGIPSPIEARRREDILVSVCLIDINASEAAFTEVAEFAQLLDAHFRFREIVLVVKAADHEAYLPLVRKVENLRLLLVREGLSSYSERVVSAAEAIGDVVLLAAPEQFDTLDHIAMIEAAADQGRIIVGLRAEPRGINRLLSLALALAGRVAGFRAGLRDGPTMALPRTLLNQLLDHSDPDLALRFVPRDTAFPSINVASSTVATAPREKRAAVRRFELIQKLVVHMAPLVLTVVTVISGLLTCLGLFYAVYVVGVWFLKPSVQPGWLTISVMLSLTTTFLGTSIFGLSVGLQRLLAMLRRDSFDNVVQEVNQIDLFGQVTSELNVDLDRTHR
jgi:hypothetical protein